MRVLGDHDLRSPALDVGGVKWYFVYVLRGIYGPKMVDAISKKWTGSESAILNVSRYAEGILFIEILIWLDALGTAGEEEILEIFPRLKRGKLFGESC